MSRKNSARLVEYRWSNFIYRLYSPLIGLCVIITLNIKAMINYYIQ